MPDGLGPSLAVLHARFLSILPHLERHGRISFHAVQCPHQRADHIAEIVGLAWAWFGRLARQGQDATRFPTALACDAARAVRSGRRLVGPATSQELLSLLDQSRRHFALGTLPDVETLSDQPASETRHDNTTSPPDDTICFRLDFTAWLASLAERNRGIAADLMVGERTRDMADKYGLSPARLTQRRRAFCQDWQAFCGKLPAPAASSALGVA